MIEEERLNTASCPLASSNAVVCAHICTPHILTHVIYNKTLSIKKSPKEDGENITEQPALQYFKIKMNDILISNKFRPTKMVLKFSYHIHHQQCMQTKPTGAKRNHYKVHIVSSESRRKSNETK